MSKEYKLTTKKKGISETFYFILPEKSLLESYEKLTNEQKNTLAFEFSAQFQKNTAKGNMVKIIRRDKRLPFIQYIFIQNKIKWMLSGKEKCKTSKKVLKAITQ